MGTSGKVPNLMGIASVAMRNFHKRLRIVASTFRMVEETPPKGRLQSYGIPPCGEPAEWNVTGYFLGRKTS